MGQTAIVLGATGVVGRELVEQLCLAPLIDEVIAITRRPIEIDSNKNGSNKITNHVVNFERLEEYANAFKADILCSCLGTTLKLAGSIENQRLVDVDYQYRGAKLALNNGVSHYLLVSSSGANPKSNSAYLKMKGELETQVKALNFPNTSIIHPSLLLGERQDFRLGEKIASALLPLLCKLPGLTKYRPITGKQVASKMCRIAIQTTAVESTQVNSASPDSKLQYYRLDELFD
ncbi:NAD(P)H-binding protein [Shewanella atlantica]|uniref:Short chain dehydrogenase n=1 Tax=Shewanella atlantica TaxID=271099 RepID=A0A3S0I8K3_9GAMM|nr:NAD(P)H-binding protein [Shewanella atlantica]RTR27205.1 short chain dehydrogenase [Shewanella atlantica]